MIERELNQFEKVFFDTVVPGFNGTFSKTLEKSYLARDIPRLCHKMKIFVEDRDSISSVSEIQIEEFDDDENNKKRLFHTLNSVADVMNNDGGEKIPLLEEDDWNKKVSVTACHIFAKFLQEFYGEECRMMRLLKMVEQGIVINFLNNFHVLTFTLHKLRMKDVRGKWNVFIERKLSGRYRISHRRTEQVTSNQLKELFQFTWEISFTFDSRDIQRIEYIEANILGIKWNEGIERDEEVEKTFVEFFGTPRFGKISEDVEEEEEETEKEVEEVEGEEEEEEDNDEDEVFREIERDIEKAINDSKGGYEWTIIGMSVATFVVGIAIYLYTQS